MRIATGRADQEDGGVPHGAALRRFATAILANDPDLDAARDALIAEVGEEATVQAASIVGCFDGLNRVADATGIRLDPEMASRGAASIVADLEFESLAAARD